MHLVGLGHSASYWLIGAGNKVVALRLGFVLFIALLGGLATVLLLDLPLYIFGVLAAAMVVAFRVAVPIVLHFVPAPAPDRQRVPVPGEAPQDGKMNGKDLLFESFITYCRHEIIPAGRLLFAYDKTDALAKEMSRFDDMNQLLPQVPDLRRHLIAVAESSSSIERFLAWQIILLQLDELYRRHQQKEQELAGEDDKEVVARSAAGARVQMAQQYLEYIEKLGVNQAGKLQADPDERVGTIRRRLNYAAKLTGKTLTIKRVGDELYFWVQPPQERVPVRRSRVKPLTL